MSICHTEENYFLCFWGQAKTIRPVLGAMTSFQFAVRCFLLEQFSIWNRLLKTHVLNEDYPYHHS